MSLEHRNKICKRHHVFHSFANVESRAELVKIMTYYMDTVTSLSLQRGTEATRVPKSHTQEGLKTKVPFRLEHCAIVDWTATVSISNPHMIIDNLLSQTTADKNHSAAYNRDNKN